MQDKTIIFGADFAPINNDGERILQGKTEEVLDKKLADIVCGAKFSVFNLEAPIVEEHMLTKPISKDGPNLHIQKGSESIYDALHVGLLSLANNHIMDYGDEGLQKTCELLDGIQIPYIGVGANEIQANNTYQVTIDNIQIGIYAVAEHEFSIASADKAGANGYGEQKAAEQISRLQEGCDYVVVLYHGGRELYGYPSPMEQKRCRQMADAGANLILCQHSHCIGAFEKYNNCNIFYGQGNFLFGDAEDDKCIYSILVQISLKDMDNPQIIPIKREGSKVVLLEGGEEQKVRNMWEQLSEDIQKEDFVKKAYKEYSQQAILPYLYQFAGWPLFLIRLDKLFGRRLIRSSFAKKKKRLLYLQNIIQCEAHREIVREGLIGLREMNK